MPGIARRRRCIALVIRDPWPCVANPHIRCGVHPPSVGMWPQQPAVEAQMVAAEGEVTEVRGGGSQGTAKDEGGRGKACQRCQGTGRQGPCTAVIIGTDIPTSPTPLPPPPPTHRCRPSGARRRPRRDPIRAKVTPKPWNWTAPNPPLCPPPPPLPFRMGFSGRVCAGPHRPPTGKRPVGKAMCRCSGASRPRGGTHRFGIPSTPSAQRSVRALLSSPAQRWPCAGRWSGACHRGRTVRCAKSLFSTTGSPGSQGPEFCTPDAVLNGSCMLL